MTFEVLAPFRTALLFARRHRRQTDRQTDDRRNSVAIAQPLVRSAKNWYHTDRHTRKFLIPIYGACVTGLMILWRNGELCGHPLPMLVSHWTRGADSRIPLLKLERSSETANLLQGRSLPSYGIPVRYILGRPDYRAFYQDQIVCR